MQCKASKSASPILYLEKRLRNRVVRRHDVGESRLPGVVDTLLQRPHGLAPIPVVGIVAGLLPINDPEDAHLGRADDDVGVVKVGVLERHRTVVGQQVPERSVQLDRLAREVGRRGEAADPVVVKRGDRLERVSGQARRFKGSV